MNHIVAALSLLLSAFLSSSLGFQAAPTPTPQSAGTTDSPQEMQRKAPRRETGNPLIADPVVQRARLNQFLRANVIDPIYRRPTETELKLVEVDPAVRARYTKFLSISGAGIFKLVPDLGCGEQTTVISAQPECLKYSLPGSGNAFSFRTNGYRIRRLADLTSSGDVFNIPGVTLQGILVKLGNVPIESISLKSAGLQFLAGFTPSGDAKVSLAEGKRFEQGVIQNGFQYARSHKIEMHMTYAMRSVAYRGEFLRIVQGTSYNELSYDRRRDLIVVFRTVAFDPNGALTIIWRELRNSESPKLHREK